MFLPQGLEDRKHRKGKAKASRHPCSPEIPWKMEGRREKKKKKYARVFVLAPPPCPIIPNLWGVGRGLSRTSTEF